jgi:hypothetical protein
MPKSTLSYRMKKLEAEIGVRLLNCTSHHFAPTQVKVGSHAPPGSGPRDLLVRPRDFDRCERLLGRRFAGYGAESALIVT